ncbi:PadR family transcriptional regulator [Pyrococcus yayanosii]|uniref:Transcription regulator, PadR-like family n=1 Tax=Pyrococcus yayanosii (strain CH1 / JCM 16557) TaxID=529709 RepID=F8AF10_PYRYC|nr:PadR family transcriptional regulator [Pyrococcus yayanosii]AEH24847.1 Transcription regulator, PadR-like family [Pyrococcus yayanosii CH1]
MVEMFNRLRDKLTKEVLWLYILRLLKERPMYAYEIKGLLKERFGFEPATVSSYVVLYKLEEEGYVTSEWHESEAGRPARKYYKLTEKGEKLFEEGIKLIEDTLKKLK